MGTNQSIPFHFDELARQGKRFPAIEQYAGLLNAMAVDDDCGLQPVGLNEKGGFELGNRQIPKPLSGAGQDRLGSRLVR